VANAALLRGLRFSCHRHAAKKTWMTQGWQAGMAVRDLPDYSVAGFCFNASPTR
jgi:hypothetical protein